MSQFSHACQIVGVAAGLAIAGGASAQTTSGDDPHAWLEDVSGEQSLEWVKARNARAEAEIAGTPAFKTLEASILAISCWPGVEGRVLTFGSLWLVTAR